MDIFPQIGTNAVTQYPAAIEYSQGVGVLPFLDGSDQRYLLQGKTFRMWHVNLSLLNESEIQQLEGFFANQQGLYSPFIFADPFTGANVSNCRFASPDFLTTYVDVDNNSTACWVIETNA